MAFDPCVGQEGRVRLGVGNTVIAGIEEWRIRKRCAEIPINHFELSANADGVVFQAFEPGLADATCSLRGHYDTGNFTETGVGIRIGVALLLDLLFTRTPFGYIDLVGFTTSFEGGTNINNQTGTFNAEVRLTGLVPSAV